MADRDEIYVVNPASGVRAAVPRAHFESVLQPDGWVIDPDGRNAVDGPWLAPDDAAAGLEASGIDARTATALAEAGVTTRAAVDAMSDDELLAINGIGAATLAKLRETPKTETDDDDGGSDDADEDAE